MATKNGFASIHGSKNFTNIFEDNNDDACGVDGEQNTNRNFETSKKKCSSTVLKSAIHRSRVKQQQYKPPERTFEQLYEKNADICIGPEFDCLNADESSLEITGGDNTTPIIRTFDVFVKPLQDNLKEKGYNRPTLIQKFVIPIIALKKGHDLIAQALTGTGKTGAFVLPIIHMLEKQKQKSKTCGTENIEFKPKAIILAPTRELAQQLGDTAKAFTRRTSVVVICTYGEIPVFETLSKIKSARGCDILVSTMGRLKQFVEENKIKLTDVKFFVMDEADKFFKDQRIYDDTADIQKMILEQSQQPFQTLMFSATFDSYIEGHAQALLRPGYFRITTNSDVAMPQSVEQEFTIANTLHEKLRRLLEILESMCKNICKDENCVTWKRLNKKVVIFCNSRRRTNWLALKLALRGWKALPTHGERTQKQRQEARDEFESETSFCDVLVSTEVTSRGLNLVGVGLIIIFEMPKTFDEYVHRIGRTGRAGNRGHSIAFINQDNITDMLLSSRLAEEMQKMNDNNLVPKMLCLRCCMNKAIPGKWCVCGK